MSWFNKGRDDAHKGRGPQNMENAPAQAREKFNAGYKYQQEQDRNKKK